MGLNFAPVPTKFPLQDTIAGMEKTARKLPKEDADDLRMRVCGILRSPEDNITKDQRKALKEMRSWKDDVILPADKGNATVVMERGLRQEGQRATRGHLQLPQTAKGPHTHPGVKNR